MSKYTTELRFICEQLSGESESQAGDKVKDIIEKARNKIFNFEYPLFDENYRSVLETKIIKHFYFKEIGFETYGQWHMYLDTTMNEIMPYYNQLYESEKLKFNPLYDTDYTVTKNGNVDKQAHQTDIGEWNGEHNNSINDIGNSKSNGSVNRVVETSGTNTNDSWRNEKGENWGTNDNEKWNTLDRKTSDYGTIDDNGNEDGYRKYTNTDWTYNHDTPQGQVNDLKTSKYLTSAQLIDKVDKEDIDIHKGNLRTNNLFGTVKDDTHETDNSTVHNNSKNDGHSNSKDTIKNEVIDNTTSNDNIDSTNNRTDTGTDGGDSSNDMNRTDNTQEKWEEKILGKRYNQSFSQLLKEFRETFLNIDMMVINDLESLFMQLW